MNSFSGKKILIGVTGSIAAYKIASLVRLLVKADNEVKVIMSKAATHFYFTSDLINTFKASRAHGDYVRKCME